MRGRRIKLKKSADISTIGRDNMDLRAESMPPRHVNIASAFTRPQSVAFTYPGFIYRLTDRLHHQTQNASTAGPRQVKSSMSASYAPPKFELPPPARTCPSQNKGAPIYNCGVTCISILTDG